MGRLNRLLLRLRGPKFTFNEVEAIYKLRNCAIYYSWFQGVTQLDSTLHILPELILKMESTLTKAELHKLHRVPERIMKSLDNCLPNEDDQWIL